MTVVRQRILAGFLSRSELLAQAQGLTAVVDPTERAKFWEDYRASRAAFAQLSALPDTPPDLRPLPSEAQAHVRALENSETFQEAFGGYDYRFLLTPIARISPMQIFCNMEPPLATPADTDIGAVLDYALPLDATIPGEFVATPTGFRFSSPRYGMGMLNLRRRLKDGRIVVTMEHINLVQIRKVGNVLVLFNGTHRALEMHRSGRSHIPALVVDHSNPAEVEWPNGPGYWNPNFLLSTVRQPAQGARRPAIPDLDSPLAVETHIAILSSVLDIGVGGVAPATAPMPQGIPHVPGGSMPHP
jgi:hypothetical protein